MATSLMLSAWALFVGLVTVIIVTTVVGAAAYRGFYPDWDAPLNDLKCVVATL
jgi:hypothetical protein